MFSDAENMIFLINLVIDHTKSVLCVILTDYIHYFGIPYSSGKFRPILEFGPERPKNGYSLRLIW